MGTVVVQGERPRMTASQVDAMMFGCPFAWDWTSLHLNLIQIKPRPVSMMDPRISLSDLLWISRRFGTQDVVVDIEIPSPDDDSTYVLVLIEVRDWTLSPDKVVF